MSTCDNNTASTSVDTLGYMSSHLINNLIVIAALACGDKLLLQVIITCLGESGGETHSPAAAHGCQICCYLDHRMPVDPEKGGIRRRRQIRKVAETGDTMNRVTFGMDWPNIAFKVRFQTLFDNIFRPPSAKYGNRLRAEQTR